MTSIQAAVLFAAGSLLVASAAMAAGRGSQSDAQATYKRDRAACMRGDTNQDRATCLKEAGAAFTEAKRGGLDDRKAEYERNRLLRCDQQPAEDRAECVRRMNEGTTSGSTQDGGVLRELRTPVSPR
jgi:hypothetical protein